MQRPEEIHHRYQLGEDLDATWKNLEAEIRRNDRGIEEAIIYNMRVAYMQGARDFIQLIWSNLSPDTPEAAFARAEVLARRLHAFFEPANLNRLRDEAIAKDTERQQEIIRQLFENAAVQTGRYTEEPAAEPESDADPDIASIIPGNLTRH